VSRDVRVLTNRSWLHGRAVGSRQVISEPFPSTAREYWRVVAGLIRSKYDAALVDCDVSRAAFLCIIKKVFPFVRCRILCVDLVLTRPNNLLGRAKFLVRRWLLEEVDRFVFYFRRTGELRGVYRIPEERVRYVPFKPNTLSSLMQMEPTDEGYFLACGRSNRDLRTLFQAFSQLPYDCRVLAPWDNLAIHGTTMDGIECPKNVSLVSDDGTPESWNRWIAGARAIVLAIEPGMLSPSGIGTYLVAMALGKCVIITEGPATWDMLDDRTAVLIPPQDAESLRAAVVRVAEDQSFRDEFERKGREYALSLGGEERLRTDVIRELSDLMSEGAAPERFDRRSL